MDILTINDDNLSENEVDKFSIKTRAVLYKDNKILVGNYNGIYLLPGGKLDKDEEVIEALQRELLEETGMYYFKEDLLELFLLRYMQRNYLTVENELLNRKIDTYYYYGEFKGIDLDNVRRSKREIEGNFKLEFIDIDELENRLEDNNNPRSKYFNKELKNVLKVYRKVVSKDVQQISKR